MQTALRRIHPFGGWAGNAAHPDRQLDKVAIDLNKQEGADGNADDREGIDSQSYDRKDKDKRTRLNCVQHALFRLAHAGNRVRLL